MSTTDSNHYMSSIHNEIINSELGYALVTKTILPQINEFPIFLSAGEVKVNLREYFQVELSEENLSAIIKFNYFVFNHVLRAMKDFVTIDFEKDAGFMLIAPTLRFAGNQFCVAMDIVEAHKNLELVDEPSIQNRANLKVTNETHLKKIVCPWYRRSDSVSLFNCFMHPTYIRVTVLFFAIIINFQS